MPQGFANFGSKLKNKCEFFSCLFVAKQPFIAGIKIIH